MTASIIPFKTPRAVAGPAAKLPMFFLPDEYTGGRFFGFFTVQRHGRHDGIRTRVDNHAMRATGITDYLKSDGSLVKARKVANHADTRTTQLYVRRWDTASLDEYRNVGI
ncbi:MAG TPA: hypothetical protein VMI94_29105 [Bryobacteraceae bacterium]|nr:hypothetical protein [Bryobacteraceae bacterium]